MQLLSCGLNRPKIIVNADDGFYSDVRDQGIVSCMSVINCGVSDVSVLVNGVVAKFLLSLSDQQKRCMSSLFSYVIQHRRIPGKHGFRSRLTSSLVHMDEVEIELESQVNAFRDIFGTIPSHFDGHQHVHILPGIDVVVAKVLSRIGIKWIRVPEEHISETSCYMTEYIIV
ncbi:Carbohydrate deacetylase [Schistosoma japonicum]|nr:Carbohydrate deacetylase [Schistosoma japonicum]